MALKTKDKMYFYRQLGYSEQVIYGKKMYRDATMKVGMWRPLPSSIDRLIDHLKVVTGHVKTESFLTVLKIHAGSVSRVRSGEDNLPQEWLIRMADYSGLSLKEIREIGGIKPTMARFDEFHLSNNGYKQAA